MPLSRLLGLAAACCVLVMAALTALLVLTGRQLLNQSQAAQDALQNVATEAASGNIQAAAEALPQARQAIADLKSTTSSPLWMAATNVPLIGTSATAITQSVDLTANLLASTTPLQQVIAGTEGTTALIAKTPQVLDALIPIRDQAQTTAQALDVLKNANLPAPIVEPIEQLASGTTQLATTTSNLLDDRAVYESILGFDGPRTYLVMLQNPAESRGSGGLFSAFMRLTLDQGQLTIDEANSRKVLDDLSIPVPTTIDQGQQRLWGNYLTKWASFNLSPDFPTTAALAQAGMRARGTPVDGVIAIDPYAVEAILAGTGPVEHKGITINDATAAAFFTKDIYNDFPGFEDVEAKDQLALGLLYATVDAALKRPLDARNLLDRTAEAADHNHIQAWIPRLAEQQWLTELGVTNTLTDIPDNEQFAVLNNATGGKVDIYLTTTLQTELNPCIDTGRRGKPTTRTTSVLTVSNGAPTNLPTYVDVRLDTTTAPPGSTQVQATLFGPAGAQEVRANGNGDFTNVLATTSYGRPTWTSTLEIPRGRSATLEVTMESPGVKQPNLPRCNAA